MIRATLFLCEETSGRWSLESLKTQKNAFSKRWENRFGILGSGARAIKQAKRAEATLRKVDKSDQDEAGKAGELEKASEALEQEALPAFLRLAWALCSRDLEFTLKQVCRFFLRDVSVPWIIRIRRGQALLLLGRTFGATSAAGTNTEIGKDLLETVMIGMMTKER